MKIDYSHDDFKNLDPIEVGGLNPYGKGDPNVFNLFKLGPNYFRGYIQMRTQFVGRTSVLDLLGGFGIWSLFLREVNDHVVCLDRVKGCEQYFGNMVRFFGADNIEFVCDEIDHIKSMRAESFDYVWMNSALQYVDRKFALSQVYRLLKPGGRLFVGNYNSTGLMLHHVQSGIQGNAINAGASQWALDALVRGPGGNGNPNYVDLDSCESVCSEFGLNLINITPQGYIDLREDRGKVAGREAPKVNDHYYMTVEFVAERPR